MLSQLLNCAANILAGAAPRRDAEGQEDLGAYRPEALEEWQRWKGEGDPPAKWWATNPETGEVVVVYRSYADYVLD